MSQVNLNSESTPIQIIDALYSLEWCIENIVAPLGLQVDTFSGEMKLTIAIGNISYLGSIGEFISHRAEQLAGIECLFVQKDPNWIQELLDTVRTE